METRKVVRKLLGLVLAVSFFASSIAENAYAAEYILTGTGHDTASVQIDTTYLESRFQNAFSGARTAWNQANCPVNITVGKNNDHSIKSEKSALDAFGWITKTYTGSKKRCVGFKIVLNNRVTTEAEAQSVTVHELGHAFNLGDNPNNVQGQFDSSIMNYNRNRKTLKAPTGYDTKGVRNSY